MEDPVEESGFNVERNLVSEDRKCLNCGKVILGHSVQLEKYWIHSECFNGTITDAAIIKEDVSKDLTEVIGPNVERDVKKCMKCNKVILSHLVPLEEYWIHSDCFNGTITTDATTVEGDVTNGLTEAIGRHNATDIFEEPENEELLCDSGCRGDREPVGTMSQTIVRERSIKKVECNLCRDGWKTSLKTKKDVQPTTPPTGLSEEVSVVLNEPKISSMSSSECCLLTGPQRDGDTSYSPATVILTSETLEENNFRVGPQEDQEPKKIVGPDNSRVAFIIEELPKDEMPLSEPQEIYSSSIAGKKVIVEHNTRGVAFYIDEPPGEVASVPESLAIITTSSSVVTVEKGKRSKKKIKKSWMRCWGIFGCFGK